ncbi:hypothetical protein [Asanoa hainanensis]|nr:hypothetical protein [Asanoa hainanensis]
MSPFTATTDADGWVTSITVELTERDGKKLKMATSLTKHGKPLSVKKPPRYDEAAEFYYKWRSRTWRRPGSVGRCDRRQTFGSAGWTACR